ncbi:MAG: acylphosphatase [Candidatus Acidiferrales bacterium]
MLSIFSVASIRGDSDKLICLRVASAPTVHEQRVAKRYYVSGIVQGVGYRYFVQRVALRLGVTGYVKNLCDGRVEVYAVGATDSLSSLRTEMQRGPDGATVSSVIEQMAAFELYYTNEFSIEYDG